MAYIFHRRARLTISPGMLRLAAITLNIALWGGAIVVARLFFS